MSRAVVFGILGVGRRGRVVVGGIELPPVGWFWPRNVIQELATVLEVGAIPLY